MKKEGENMGSLNNDINIYLNPNEMKDLKEGKTVCLEAHDFDDDKPNHLIKIVMADKKWALKRWRNENG